MRISRARAGARASALRLGWAVYAASGGDAPSASTPAGDLACADKPEVHPDRGCQNCSRALYGEGGGTVGRWHEAFVMRIQRPWLTRSGEGVAPTAASQAPAAPRRHGGGGERHASERQERRPGQGAAERRVRGRAPKIRGGTISGRTRIARIRPPRRSARVSAAPIAPMKVSAGVPTSSVATSGSIAARRQRDRRPKSGAASASGSPVASQWASTFARTTAPAAAARARSRSSEPSSSSRLEQPVEPDQGRQQRADPEDAGPIAPAGRDRARARRAGWRRSSGRRRAPSAPPPPTRAASRRSRRSRARRRRSSRRSRRPDRAARRAAIGRAAHASPRRSSPPVDEVRLHEPERARLGGGVERRGRLVEQPERPAGNQKAGQRHAPPLAGREIGDRQSRRMRQARAASSASPAASAALAEQVAGRSRDSRRRSAPFSSRRDGRRDGSASASGRSRCPRRRIRPAPAAAARRAIASRLDLPAPLRPVSASASPGGEREAEGSRKRSRPPRRQARFDPSQHRRPWCIEVGTAPACSGPFEIDL